MLNNSFKQKDIAQAVGVTESYVSYTINGLRNSKAVLLYLKDKGCDQAYLDIPKKYLDSTEVEIG